MKAEDFFTGVLSAMKKLKNAEAELEVLRIGRGVTNSGIKPKGVNGDPVGLQVQSIMELEEQLQMSMPGWEREVSDGVAVICSIGRTLGAKHRLVMECLYIAGLSIRDTADKCGCSTFKANALKKEALSWVDEVGLAAAKVMK